MKQAKPHLFWIISGVVVLIELGLIFFYPLTDQNGKTPEEVKTTLDAAFKELADLHKRAGQEPKGVYDPEDPRDIEKLTKLYLLTPKWKGVLQPHVDKYIQQLAEIKKDLASRSVVLHQAISENADRFAWYTAYVGKTKEVLLSLRKAKALWTSDDMKPEDLDFESGTRVRAQVGFYTKLADFPEVGEHPQITARFRILEKVAEALIATRVTTLPNPVTQAELGDGDCAMIAGAEWKVGGDPEKLLGDAMATTASGYELTLTLHGSASALIAAEGAIERIGSPVLVVVGGTLGQRQGLKAGERKGVPNEVLVSRLTIVALDFTKIATVQAPEATKASETKATEGGKTP